MRTRLTIALTLCLLTLLAGCNKGNKLVGTWTTTMAGQPADVTFNADESAMVQFTIQQAPVTGTVVKITATYKEDGDKLHFTMKDATLSNLPAEMKDKEAALTDAIKKPLGLGTERVEALKWVSDTSFTTTDATGTATTYTKKA